MGAAGWLGCPMTVWLWLWPGVTFLTNHHFACIGLVCAMSLHVKQSSLTYISSPKDNTPCTKGCVTEHLNTLKKCSQIRWEIQDFFVLFLQKGSLSLWVGFSLLLNILRILLHLSLIATSQNFHHVY